jgi:DNA modification methylase
MLDCSKRGGLILDAFGGSGTTAIAAERTGRTAALIELDPRYVDVALRRFCDVTGIEPVNAWTGSRVERRTTAKAA